MNLKTLSAAILSIALPLCSHAQDKIYKTNGDVVDVKIKSVGTKTVTYLRFDNQSGPEYTIVKADVEKITYQNGTTEMFPAGRRPKFGRRHAGDKEDEGTEKASYGANLLALAPIQFSENGLGFGLSYERALDKKGIIAFYLPALMTLDLNGGTYFDNNSGTYVNGHQDMMLYFLPGIKIYPTGSFGVVRYAIGPSICYATGEKSTVIYDPNLIGSSKYVTQPHTMLGMVINNSLNINPTPKIYMGLELGLGFSYLNRVNGLNQDTRGIVQGSFKVGYRF